MKTESIWLDAVAASARHWGAVARIGLAEPFELADYAQWRLLEGLDDIALTLRHEQEISAFEAGRPAWLPSLRGDAVSSPG